MNGDGYTDLVVGANPAGPNDLGHVYLYLGSAAGLPATPTVTLTNPAGQQTDFGRLSNAGDVNGDGYADLVVGDDGFGRTTGRAYIYLGGPTGYAAAPQVALDGPDGPIGCFGRWVSGAEDINGDGYADVVVGADAEALLSSTPDGGAAQPAGWAHVYFGNAVGVSPSPTITLVGPDGPDTWFGPLGRGRRRCEPRRLRRRPRGRASVKHERGRVGPPLLRERPRRLNVTVCHLRGAGAR